MTFNTLSKAKWLKDFKQSQFFQLSGVTEGAEAFVIHKLGDEAVVFIAENDKHLAKVKSYLKVIAPEKSILEFPAWDIVPYGRSSPSAHIQSKRLKTLVFLAQKNKSLKNHIILTTVSAVSQYVIPQNSLRQAGQVLQTGSSISTEKLAQILNDLGYKHVSLVREAGEYATRGGLMDIYPSGEDKGYRLDFFGDEIENINLFDPSTQRSYEKTNKLSLIPASEVLLNETNIKNFRKTYREIAPIAANDDLLYTAISNGASWPAMEHWLPLFYQKLESFFDYIEASIPIILPFGFYERLTERLDSVQDYYQSRLDFQGDETGDIYVPVAPESFFESQTQLQERLEKRQILQLSPFIENDKTAFIQTASIPLFYDMHKGHKSLLEKIEEWITEQNLDNYIILAKSEASKKRIETLFKDKNILVVATSLREAFAVKPPYIALISGSIDRGIIYEKTAFISDNDLIGQSYKLNRKKRRAEDVILQASSLSEGDYIVHNEHGIGRYEGLETIQTQNILHDCLKLLYDGGDRLFVPVENLEILSRYGGENENVSLDKLGSTAWQARRAKAKERINEMAEKLVEIAAKRQIKKANPVEVPQGSFEEFCNAFPYSETDDQLNAIEDVASDLSSGKIMDRLICGDVGFGKTEVALRAAFLSVMSGYQVAVIVPTTLLARQHYNNFVKRFENFPIRIAQLSRMVTPKQAKQTKKDMVEGKVDIVIGTHALLSQDIAFNRLHLVIVDEEQHFGVAHKEKLKALRDNVHMLTLTATPIPRTLQMALTGVRDLSIIATPPVDRLAIRTFIQKYDAVTIREALLRESFRGGQSFFVCPRLKDVRYMEDKLTKLLPELKIGVAHGQMAVKQLEDTITAFVNKEFDILLSTQIVESGIDMPNVNTIIIYRPDMFGLAQLYQLRGRVGRGNIRAWAWLVLDPRRTIKPAAMKRLEVMQSLDNLGAGFTIASHDLDQRGAGNLLGEEQSGHIKEVGLELYQKMIEEAVHKAKDDGEDKQRDEAWSSRINVGISVMIPQDYIPDLDIRMNLYRRIANIENLEEQEYIEEELVDRFGELPLAVKNLLDVTQIKQRCKKLGILQLDAGSKGVVVQFYNQSFKNPEGLINFIMQNAAEVKLRADQSIAFTKNIINQKEKMSFINNILDILENL